ncbi:Uncharacterised protein [Mycobacteroides abscessus subsp. abscessus]|nr:Uncharacterised protein [Mycobacteroides abscessus subsp. abscessus]
MHCAYQLLGGRVLQNEPGSTGAQRTREQLVVVKCGERQRRRSLRGMQQANRLDTTHLLHPQIHDHHVGPRPAHRSGDLAPIGALPHYREAVLATQNPAQPRSHKLLIIDQQNAHLDVSHDATALSCAGNGILSHWIPTGHSPKLSSHLPPAPHGTRRRASRCVAACR